MASIDFVHSAFKISLRVVFQFDLDVVQCAVLLWVSAIVFFCSTRVVDLLWFSYAVLNMVRCMRGFSFTSVVRYVVRFSFATSRVSFGVCEVANANTSVGRSSTYVK